MSASCHCEWLPFSSLAVFSVRAMLFTVVRLAAIHMNLLVGADAATVLCAPGSPYSTSTVDLTAGDFAAIGCRFTGFTTFVARNLATAIGGSPTNITIEYGAVAAGNTNALVFSAPSEAAAITRGPLHITVRRVTFETNTQLRLIGTLPPHSRVFITGCSFNPTATNKGGSNYLTGPTSIMVGEFNGNAATSNFALFPGTIIEIMENTATANIPFGSGLGSINDESYWFVYIMAIAGTLAAGSALRINNNSIVVREALRILIAMYDGSTTLALAGGVLETSGNTIRDSNVRSGFLGLALTSGSDITVSGGGSFNVSHNTIRNCSTPSFVFAFLYVTLTASFVVLEGSRFDLVGNAFLDSYTLDTLNALYLVTKVLRVAEGSVMDLSGTLLTNISPPKGAGATAEVAAIYIDATTRLVIEGRSRLIIEGGSINGARSSGAAMYTYISTPTITVANASSLELRGATVTNVSSLSCAVYRFPSVSNGLTISSDSVVAIEDALLAGCEGGTAHGAGRWGADGLSCNKKQHICLPPQSPCCRNRGHRSFKSAAPRKRQRAATFSAEHRRRR